MMKKLLGFFLFTLSLNLAKAQNNPHYSHFMFNQLSINPAYAGSKKALHIMGLYRNQWQGIVGAPKTMNLHAHMPIAANRSGLGLSLMSDQIGISNTLFVDASYAYRVPIDKKRTISFGLKGRLEYTRQDWTMSEAIDVGDDVIPLEATSATRPNFGVGVYYEDDWFYVGLSTPSLLRTAAYDNQNLPDTDTRAYQAYYLIGGMVTQLTKGVKIRPSMMLSYNPNTPVGVNLSTSLIFFDAFWVGASYRLDDSINFLTAYQFNKQIKASLAVDFTTSALRKHAFGSFEIMMEYLIEPDCKCLNNLRFF